MTEDTRNIRPKITEGNRLQCSKHSQVVTKVEVSAAYLSSGLEFLCPECPLNKWVEAQEPIFNIDKQHQFYTVTLSGLSAPVVKKDESDEVIDFRNMEVEQIIIDEKAAKGYGPRNLVYIPDKNLLVACGLQSNHISIWSIDDIVQWKSEINVESHTWFAKYINRGDCGPNYLILGTDSKANVYEIINDRLTFVNEMSCETRPIDAEYIPQSDKIVISGYGHNIYIWDLKTFSLERTIDVKACGTQGPIYRVIYLSHKNALALENWAGICLISLEEEGLKTEGFPKHYRDSNRSVQGLAYLPESRCFILRRNNQIDVIDEDNFTLREREFSHSTDLRPTGALSADSQMLINEDESQCMTSVPSGSLFVYLQDGSFHNLPISSFRIKNAALEIIKDQHRVIMGDQDSGTIYVLRTNTKKKTSLQFTGTAFPPEARKRGRQPAKKKAQPAKSKDQIKEKAAKKDEDKEKPKSKNAKANKGNKGSEDGAMEIEKPKKEKDEVVPKRETRSRSRKEPEETEKKETKTKAKGGRGKSQDEKEAEKDKERSKSRKGKKK